MWQNLQWLRAEWAYYFEWKKLALVGQLEGATDRPPRNSPWSYTFAWLGIVVVFPSVILGVLSVLVMAMLDSPRVTQVVLIVTAILLTALVIFYIIFSFVRMDDSGPSRAVVDHWAKTHAENTKGA